jgi:hypothetical protein
MTQQETDLERPNIKCLLLEIKISFYDTEIAFGIVHVSPEERRDNKIKACPERHLIESCPELNQFRGRVKNKKSI